MCAAPHPLRLECVTAPSRIRTRPRPHLFEGRPRLVVAVAGLLFAAVLAIRLFAGDANDAYSMLYVLPIALLATTFGIRAGAAASLLAVALVGVWSAIDEVSLGVTGWVTRVVPLLLLGVLLGESTDRTRRAELERRRLEAAALLHREAIEINDSIVQGMAAAKWSLEAGRIEAGLHTLDQTMSKAHQLVSDLIRRAEMGQHSEPLEGVPLRARD